MSPQEERAERAITDTEQAGEQWARAADLETVLENAKPLVKMAVVARLMSAGVSEEKPLGDKTALSATAAEKAAATDPEYQEHLEQLRIATLTKNTAYNRMISGRLRALLAVTRLAGEMEGQIDNAIIEAQSDVRKHLVGGVPK